MRFRFSWCIGGALGLLFATTASAATYSVNVGGTMAGGGGYYGDYGTTPVLMFQPAQLTLNVGDSVTFVNVGGTGAPPHNVHADDGSFRCANGCDGQGGNGTPATNEWTASVTFTKPGIVNYHCDQHVGMGMTGSITVNAAATTKPIGPSTSGAWYNTDQSGSGFLINVLPNNVFLAVWFVFTPSGGAQSWIYAQGTYDPTSNSITIPSEGVFVESGTAFPPNFDKTKVARTTWGTITFSFSDCNNGNVSWTSSIYGNGSMPITRLTGLAGLTCQ